MNMSPEHIKAREEYFESRRNQQKKTGEVKETGVTAEDIKRALLQYAGNITDAANHLALLPTSLRTRIYKTEELLDFQRELRDQVLDLAESELYKQVKGGNMTAIIFILRTIGRERGYTEKVDVNHDISQGLMQKTAAHLIDAMRKGIANVPTVEIEGKAKLLK